MLSECPKCGCREFELIESPGKSSSVLVMCCDNCGYVDGAMVDNTPSEVDDIVSKFEKYSTLKAGSFK